MSAANNRFISLIILTKRACKISLLILGLTALNPSFAQETAQQSPAQKFIKTAATPPSPPESEEKYYDDIRSHFVVYSLIITVYGLYWLKASKS
jgi:hypothetical protein